MKIIIPSELVRTRSTHVVHGRLPALRFYGYTHLISQMAERVSDNQTVLQV
jgi:hypothetical protein